MMDDGRAALRQGQGLTQRHPFVAWLAAGPENLIRAEPVVGGGEHEVAAANLSPANLAPGSRPECSTAATERRPSWTVERGPSDRSGAYLRQSCGLPR